MLKLGIVCAAVARHRKRKFAIQKSVCYTIIMRRKYYTYGHRTLRAATHLRTILYGTPTKGKSNANLNHFKTDFNATVSHQTDKIRSTCRVIKNDNKE